MEWNGLGNACDKFPNKSMSPLEVFRGETLLRNACFFHRHWTHHVRKKKEKQNKNQRAGISFHPERMPLTSAGQTRLCKVRTLLETRLSASPQVIALAARWSLDCGLHPKPDDAFICWCYSAAQSRLTLWPGGLQQARLLCPPVYFRWITSKRYFKPLNLHADLKDFSL